MIRIHFVGGEKGGVGKSVLARVLAQYHIDRNKPFTAFDGDLSHGALIRYYGDYAKAVDISNFESVDQIAEVAAEQGCDVIVDLAAQSARNIDRWMQESGLVELAEEIGVVVTLWHVMDDGTDSIRLLDKMLDTYGADPDYILVRNRGRGNDFSLFDKSAAKTKAESFGATSIDLPQLHAGSMRKIDRVGASLWSAANNKDEALGPTLGLLERQRVKVWLNKAYAELDRVLGK
ncbi:mobilization protein [Thiomicrorhabdus sp. 6S2-11]|uniref:Mobilization protein n=1 Tax=Thiomicrorhabdus marina TaxID=2818442 RepID=A0ABS3Q3Y7_9GAMM|nr:mobilization protein [Thiomicrorhabdus marina]MBO1926545.1 mobilization protein [Thiomicrorhabdus marina]